MDLSEHVKMWSTGSRVKRCERLACRSITDHIAAVVTSTDNMGHRVDQNLIQISTRNSYFEEESAELVLEAICDLTQAALRLARRRKDDCSSDEMGPI